MITDEFQVKLESALQWECWEIKLFEKISTQIPTTEIQPYSPTRVYELNRIDGRSFNSFGGYWPVSGAHMVDGTLYTGFYSYNQWIRKELVPQHDAIRANRKQRDGDSTRKGLMINRKAEICAQILEL